MRQGVPYALEQKTNSIESPCPGWARNSYEIRGLDRLRIFDTINLISHGALAQLASALPWHGRGRGFESPMLHQMSLTVIDVLIHAVAEVRPGFM